MHHKSHISRYRSDNREGYSLKRVDMSQYLPKMNFPEPKIRNPDPFNCRSRSQNPKPRKIYLNDALAKKHANIPPMYRAMNDKRKPNSPENHLQIGNMINKSNSPKKIFTKYPTMKGTREDKQRLSNYYDIPSRKTQAEIRNLALDSYRDRSNESDHRKSTDLVVDTRRGKLSQQHSVAKDHFSTVPSPPKIAKQIVTEEDHITRFDDEYAEVNPVKREEQPIDENILQEYGFLNQAKSINIFSREGEQQQQDEFDESNENNNGIKIFTNADEYERIDISMLREQDQGDRRVNDAIEALKSKYSVNWNLDGFLDDLDVILNCNYNELKIVYDFTVLSEFFCKLLQLSLEESPLDFKRKMGILSFLLSFCEEALYGLNLNFDEIYKTIMDYSINLLKQTESVAFDIIKMHKTLNKSILQLHKYFAQEFYVIPLDKLEIIFKTFTQFLQINLDVFNNESISNEAKFFTTTRSIPMYSIFSAECIIVFKLLLKRSDLRQLILQSLEAQVEIITLLNYMNSVIQVVTSWPIDNLKEKNKQSILQYTLNSFEIYVIIFKFCEMYQLEGVEVQDTKLIVGLGDQFTRLFEWLEIITSKRKLLTLLFEKASDSAMNTPMTAQGLLMSSGIADLIDSMFCLTNNLKLYEEEKIDFEKLVHQIASLLSLIKRLVESRRFEQDFQMFITACIRNPLKKMAEKIVIHVKQIKGSENCFEKPPLSP